MARPKKNYRTPTANEPEELNPANVNGADPARAALAKERKRKAKHDPFIDMAVNWLKSLDVANDAVDTILRDVYAMTNIDAAARLGFLKQVKLDGRLTIIGGGVDCRLAVADEQPQEPTPATDIAPENKTDGKVVEGKTIADHLADAQGRQTRLPFPHGIGTWVCYAKDDFGVTPAQILNMTTTGNVTMYDLKTEGGKKLKDVPAFEIEQLPAQEEARIRDHAQLTQLQKHNEDGQRLAQMLAAEQAEEVEQAGELKATRKRIDKLREQIDSHLCGVPLDDQMTIDMDDDGTSTVSGANYRELRKDIVANLPTAQERLLGRITGNDTLELTDDNQPWDKLHPATLKAEASTGKPQKIVPLTINQAPGQWVCVGYQERTAILLQAYSKEQWKEKYEAKFGKPRELPSDEPTVNQLAGGPLTGVPVKVGRATLYLAPLDDALLLKLPAAVAQA